MVVSDKKQIIKRYLIVSAAFIPLIIFDAFLPAFPEIAGFCDGIKKDIVPVRNAISMDASSGFVEGNNNKFKLIKRILFGRAGLDNLAKKCKLTFATKNPDFSLQDLL